MKRRILLVDDEVAVLLTMKAILEISGFDVDTAASAREGKLRLRSREYDMIITDMRMENDEAGREVVKAALTAPYRPAVALLTAFPVDDEDWQSLGADKLLLKPMHTRILLQQIEQLFAARERKLGPVSATVAPKLSKSKKGDAASAVAARKSFGTIASKSAKKAETGKKSSKATRPRAKSDASPKPKRTRR